MTLLPRGFRAQLLLAFTGLLTVTAGRAVFDDDEVLCARLAALRKAVGPDAARLMVLRSPLIMTSDIERSAPERISALRAMLPDDVDLAGVLVRAP